MLEFLLAAIVLVLLPGPNTVIILAHSISGGRSAGLATVAGVELGTMLHTLAAALGLSALLSASPLSFLVVKFAGASYLIIVGAREIDSPSPDGRGWSREAGPGEGSLPKLTAFRRALFTQILNPKVAVFFLALLPQFVRPEAGHVFLQFVMLGLILSAVGIFFGSLLAIAAGTFSTWLQRHEGFQQWQHRFTGAVLIALGVRLAFTHAT